MTDQALVDGFWSRDEDVIRQLDWHYGAQCRALSNRILRNREDAEECVNEAYYRLWDSIPPQRPSSVFAYLSRVVRNLSLDRLRENGSLKRGGNAVRVALDELSNLQSSANVEEQVQASELGKAIDRCLRLLPQAQCDMFLRRYFYFETRDEISQRFGVSPAQVSVQLSRARKKLAQLLRQEGYL